MLRTSVLCLLLRFSNLCNHCLPVCFQVLTLLVTTALQLRFELS
jgi:hypothetical protein